MCMCHRCQLLLRGCWYEGGAAWVVLRGGGWAAACTGQETWRSIMRHDAAWTRAGAALVRSTRGGLCASGSAPCVTRPPGPGAALPRAMRAAAACTGHAMHRLPRHAPCAACDPMPPIHCSLVAPTLCARWPPRAPAPASPTPAARRTGCTSGSWPPWLRGVGAGARQWRSHAACGPSMGAGAWPCRRCARLRGRARAVRAGAAAAWQAAAQRTWPNAVLLQVLRVCTGGARGRRSA